MKKEKGITLIALVVTIIVLLILAGIAINLSIGNNGLFSRAKDSKKQTEITVIKERAGADILGAQADNKSGDITKEQLVEILETYFENVPEAKELPEDLSTVILTAKKEYGGHEIKASDIYDGGLAKEQETIAKSESYVGYYADFQKADGSDGSDGIPDGIIYADLAVGGSGAWGNDNDWGNYAYESVDTGLKEYYISQTGYNGIFGTKDVLSPMEDGADRFYVMALEDVNPGTVYCWYAAAYGKLDKTVEGSANDFGQGRENTRYVMDKWDKGTNEGGWGAHDDDSFTDYSDVWGMISDIVKPDYEWFVPSKSEWATFAFMMSTKFGVTTSNYNDFGLGDCYWSSSTKSSEEAFDCGFSFQNIAGGGVYFTGLFLRLSTTF